MLSLLGAGGAGSAPVVPVAPDGVTGLAGWYWADTLGLSDTDAVASWGDASGQGNLLAQGTAGSRPVFRTGIINGLPVVRFDGTDDFIRINSPSGFAGQTGLTIIAVANSQTFPGSSVTVLATTASGFNELRMQTNVGATSYAWQGIAGSGSQASGTADPAAPPPFRVASMVFNDATNTLIAYRNGVPGNTATEAGAASASEIMIGSRSGTSLFWKGDIAEVAIWPRPLTNAERAGVEMEMAGRYGITLT